MNVFIFEESLFKSASYLSNAHLNKQILEIEQLISTRLHYEYVKARINKEVYGLRIVNGKYKIKIENEDVLYIDVPDIMCLKEKHTIMKPTHFNHPITKHVINNDNYFAFVKNYLRVLVIEYMVRLNKMHDANDFYKMYCSDVEEEPNYYVKKEDVIYSGTEKFKNNNPFECYKMYYKRNKLTDKNGKPHKWTNRLYEHHTILLSW